jgi:hypothetical protein
VSPLSLSLCLSEAYLNAHQFFIKGKNFNNSDFILIDVGIKIKNFSSNVFERINYLLQFKLS